MSKNITISTLSINGLEYTLKLSTKVGIYYVVGGKAHFFGTQVEKYWNTPEDIAAATSHLIAITHINEESKMNKEEEEVIKNPETNPCIGCEFPMDCCTMPIKEDEDEIPSSDERTAEFTLKCANCKKYHMNANDLRICCGAPIVDQPLDKNTPLEVLDTQGNIVRKWFNGRTFAQEYCDENNFGYIEQAKNKHGWWAVKNRNRFYQAQKTNPTGLSVKSILCKKCGNKHTGTVVADIVISIQNCEG